MQEQALFNNTFIYQQPLIVRLLREFKESSHDFRQSPKAYFIAAFRDDSIGSARRKELLRFGMAVGILVFTTAFFSAVILPKLLDRETFNAWDAIHFRYDNDLFDISDATMVEVNMPKADKRAGGGGGGGKQQPTPPSVGRPPTYSLAPQIVNPTTQIPLRPPVLPVQMTVQVDPSLQPKFDPNIAIGDPKGVLGPPSDGPGTGGGIGTGTGTGVGPGDGTGLGPGHGFNTGGGDPGIGGGDRNPDGSARAVDVKPRLLNNPRPLYTEEARKNKIQGVVKVRVLVGTDGSVKKVSTMTHLPDGLDEQAIAAAYKLRFTSAMRGGSPVAYWVPVEIEFNLR